MRAFDGFVASYDPRLRNPRWVLERITRDSFKGDGDRINVQFMEDGSIEERFRARLSDYKASGYDKGHLAPAANHKGSQQSVVDTFNLTNIAPQVSSGAKTWVDCLLITVDQTSHPSQTHMLRSGRQRVQQVTSAHTSLTDGLSLPIARRDKHSVVDQCKPAGTTGHGSSGL